MIFSEKLFKKLMKIQFKSIDANWIKTIYYYLIDNKYRTRKRLDKFLKDQLKNPDSKLKNLALSLRKKDTDTTIINILKWVHENIKYTRDIDNFGRTEYWADANLTYSLGKDDCDGMNGLIYILARLAGIGSQCLYCAIGNVVGGGHFWVLYYSPREDKLVTIDSTYYFSSKEIKDRQSFELSDIKKYKTIWYVFNEENIFKPQ